MEKGFARTAIRGGLAAALMLGACGGSPDLVGMWRTGSARGQMSAYVFLDAATGFRVDSGRVEEFRYAADFRRDPVSLDLWIGGDSAPARRVVGIVQMLPGEHMRLKLAPPGGMLPSGVSPASPGVTYRRTETR